MAYQAKLFQVLFVYGLFKIPFSANSTLATTANSIAVEFHFETRKPADFVNVKNQIPEIKIDMRYFNGNNFVGRKINGYNAPLCLLTESATDALKNVVNVLKAMGLTLKMHDCYRPQTAVNHFIAWSSEADDITLKAKFYPTVKKSNLFNGYIAKRSGHTRGSTVDLTIVPINASSLNGICYGDEIEQTCASQEEHIDFGTIFDYLDPKSHFAYKHISAQAKANRLLLNLVMTQAGFKGYEKEWWHFTLVNELYPDTYFDFSID